MEKTNQLTEQERNALWKQYYKTKTPEIRNKIIIEYAYLIKIVAGKLCLQFGENVDYDDLISIGTFGLIQAIDSFVPDKGVLFSTYAPIKIRGYILDEFRRNDWVSRQTRERIKKYDHAKHQLLLTKGKVSKEDMKAVLDVDEKMYHKYLESLSFDFLVSLDEFLDQGNQLLGVEKNSEYIVLEELRLQEMKDAIKAAYSCLTEKEKQILNLIYFDELTMKEVALLVGVTSARISQAHKNALNKMKKYLENNNFQFSQL